MKIKPPACASDGYAAASSMRARHRCGAALLALSSSGCAALLWPHHERRLPATSGRVVAADMPVAGARVYLSAMPDRGGCRESKHMAITDPEGRFEIPGDRALTWLLVFGDRLASRACASSATA